MKPFMLTLIAVGALFCAACDPAPQTRQSSSNLTTPPVPATNVACGRPKNNFDIFYMTTSGEVKVLTCEAGQHKTSFTLQFPSGQFGIKVVRSEDPDYPLFFGPFSGQPTQFTYWAPGRDERNVPAEFFQRAVGGAETRLLKKDEAALRAALQQQ